MATNPRRLPYRDLTTHYPTPATGDPASAGWWRQAANNLSLMANAAQLNALGRTGTMGYIPFTPSWVGITTTVAGEGGYVRVGQTCYLWASATISDLSSTPAGLGSLPVAPSDSIVRMHAGYGYVYDGTSTRLPFAAEISGGALTFYWSAASTAGTVITGDPLTAVSGGEIGVYATYRVDPPEAGTLNGYTYVVEAVEA